MVKDSDPVALPAEVGAKLTFKELLLPGAMVRGVDRPVMANPLPETLAEETVRLAVPVFVSAITLPKLTLDGTAEIRA